MDSEPEELQFLGFFGIYKEAYKLVLSWRRIFSQIIVSFILPLSAVFLAHVAISFLLFTKIDHNQEALENSAASVSTAARNRLRSLLASEWTAVILFKGVYLVFVLVFSLLSTSAVVYTVACAYTGKEITFSKIVAVVPKVWKRLMVTFLWNFLILFLYNLVALAALVAVLLIVFFFSGSGGGAFETAAVVLVLIAYIVGLVYVSVVWHVASVVSVLEDSCGLAAMRKSRLLLKGKVGLALSVFLAESLSFAAVELGFRRLVVEGDGGGNLMTAAARLGVGAAMMSVLSALMMMGLVVQSIVYFVCKSYHHESLDKSNLADHLEVYHGEYVPLTGKDVQLEPFHV